MDDAAGVGGGEAVGDRGADLGHFLPRYRAGPDPLAQRLAFEQLHHRHRHVVDDRELVDGDDARMGQRGNGAGFGFEPPPHLRDRTRRAAPSP